MNIDSLPTLWQEGYAACQPGLTAFNPANGYPQGFIPVEHLAGWFCLGVAKELRLYRYGNNFCLECLGLGFTTEREPIWLSMRSTWLEVGSEAEAIELIKQAGLMAAYSARFRTPDEYGAVYLNW